MAKDTKITYTDNDRAIVKALKENPDGLTLAQLCEATGLELKPGHITSAMTHKGLIESAGKVEVMKDGKRKVATYTFATAEPQNKADGKPANYTDNEKEVLKAAGGIDGAFTLAQLAEVMGVEKLTSGRINGLVNKGNITKGDKIEIPCKVKSQVNLYVLKEGAEDKING